MSDRNRGSQSCLAALLRPNMLSILYFSETLTTCESISSGVDLGAPHGQPGLRSSAEFPVQTMSPASCTSLSGCCFPVGLCRVRVWRRKEVGPRGRDDHATRRDAVCGKAQLARGRPQPAPGCQEGTLASEENASFQKEVRSHFIGPLAVKF